MTRYATAIEREKGKLSGVDVVSVDMHPDPLAAQLANRDEKKPQLKHLGGSDNDAFNIAVAESVRQSAWITSDADREHAIKVIGSALAGIAPKDEMEGMLAAQMIAAHQAAMECYRRAMIQTQAADFRDQLMGQAAKASRTYATLLETLNRHRNKGQQRVVVEHVHRHVHVHEGASAIPHIEAPGDGVEIEKTEQPHAQKAPEYALEPSLRSEDEEHETVSRASDGERPMPNARRK